MVDRREDIEYKDLVITDAEGEKIFELNDIGILSVEDSEGSLKVEIELNNDLRYGRSVFKTE